MALVHHFPGHLHSDAWKKDGQPQAAHWAVVDSVPNQNRVLTDLDDSNGTSSFQRISPASTRKGRFQRRTGHQNRTDLD